MDVAEIAHYCQKRSVERAGCGPFSLLPRDAIFTRHAASVTCPRCLESDDYKAQSMENALGAVPYYAMLVKEMPPGRSIQRLYETELGGPLPQYVIVSAADAFGEGPETFIFKADAAGEIIDWGELEGSFKGAFDHEQAMRNAGYTIVTEFP